MTEASRGPLVEELMDRHEISDLVYRLGVCLDETRFDELGSLLVEDATAHTRGGTAQGRVAVVAQAERNHRPEDRIQHVITNLLVELEGDRAKVRANLMAHFAPRPDAGARPPVPPIRYVLGEVYHFNLVRIAGGWRFARIATIPIWRSGEQPRVPAGR
jgi:hypothetical protein